MKVIKEHKVENIQEIIKKEREETDSDGDDFDKPLECMMEDHINIDS